MQGTQYRALDESRRKDMQALLEKKRHDGAKYIGGYVIECFLKYLITKRQNVASLPAVSGINDLNVLAGSAFAPDEWLLGTLFILNKIDRLEPEWFLTYY